MRYLILAIALALAGCAASEPALHLSDAVTAESRFGAAETGSFGGVITGRDWTCGACYK
jgi:hypothetical protein